MIFCHIHRLTRALHLHNSIGWDIVRKHFKQIVPRDHLLYKTFLEQDKINYKCFMKMKCDGLYRDVSINDIYLFTYHNNLIISFFIYIVYL